MDGDDPDNERSIRLSRMKPRNTIWRVIGGTLALLNALMLNDIDLKEFKSSFGPVRALTIFKIGAWVVPTAWLGLMIYTQIINEWWPGTIKDTVFYLVCLGWLVQSMKIWINAATAMKIEVATSVLES